MLNNVIKEKKIIKIKSFLQSSEWEEFQSLLGRKTFRVKNKLIIKMPLTLRQSYLYCPRSECMDGEFGNFLKAVKKIAKREESFFARFEPVNLHKNNFEKFKLRKVSSRQPDKTLLINLSQSEETILSNMKQKTRYNIKIAQKKNILVKKSVDIKDVKLFYKIYEETAKRDKIKIQDLKYFQKMAKVFLKHKKFAIYMAYYKDTLLASNLLLYHDKVAYYLHGSSSNQSRNFMAPYILQWKAICDARKNNYKWYDFWGVSSLSKDPLDSEKLADANKIFNLRIKNFKHSWHGITKFKLGFAPNTITGEYVEYPGCYEISYGKKRYLLYSMFKRAF